MAFFSQALLRQANPLDIALFLHLGTLFAVLFYFQKDWKKVLMLKRPKLLRFLIISTFVSLAIGFPLYKAVRSIVMGNSLLLVMGFGFAFTAYFHKKKRILSISLNKLAVLAGVLQGLAVIPGLSRSGATIFGLSFGRLSPPQVLKISYMMSVPVVLVSSAFLAIDNPSLVLEGWPSLALSFLVGLLSLHFLIKLSEKIDFFKFALIFSLLCFLGAGIGLLS